MSLALAGDERAIRSLVARLAPVIQARVARIMWSRFGRTRDLAEAVADATQDVFAALFADDAKVLRTWDPAGLSLENFVGLVAERHVLSGLRAGSRTGARERSATEEEILERSGADSGPASTVEKRMVFDAVVARVEAELTPQGQTLFRMLFVEGKTIEAICVEVSMTADAVYAWRSRLLKTVRRVAEEIDGAPIEETSETTVAERIPERRSS